jgi:hypothetical protein
MHFISSSQKKKEWCLLRRVFTYTCTHPPPPFRRTHPSTRLIEEVLESIHQLAGVGPGIKKIIVADGVKVRDNSKFRAGVVTAEDDAAYRHYLSRVHHLTNMPGSSLFGAELIALDERHGGGLHKHNAVADP